MLEVGHIAYGMLVGMGELTAKTQKQMTFNRGVCLAEGTYWKEGNKSNNYGIASASDK